MLFGQSFTHLAKKGEFIFIMPYYSSIGIIALLIHLIINYYLIFNSSSSKLALPKKNYLYFLHSVMIYYITDILWGICMALKMPMILFLNTELYFAAMATAIFLWTRFVISYLNQKSVFSTFLKYFGVVFIVFQTLILMVNIFFPVMFAYDKNGDYHTKIMRYVTLFIQLFLFMLTAIHTLVTTLRIRGRIRKRYRTVCLFGFAMTLFTILQAYYPFLPMYAIGCMIGTCLIHTFVDIDEREERRAELEQLLQVEEIREAELGSARHMAYTDPLTNVKNKNSYQEDVLGIERRIEDKLLKELCVVVFDLNNLKAVNDTKGHEEGDKYIKQASKMICHHFKHSPVYRTGGDEFVAFLYGEDYKNKENLLRDFTDSMKENQKKGGIVISCGSADFSEKTTKSFDEIFEAADMKMYECKRALKAL